MSREQPVSRSTLPGEDDITRVELDNGIIVLTRPNFNSPSAIITGYLPSGGLFDLDEKLGLAYFSSLALMRGCEGRSFQEIYDTLESIGASLGFSVSVHNTSFGGRALVEDLPKIMNVFSDCLRCPTFPPEQIERLRYQLLTSLAIRNQSTSQLASMAFDEIVFRGHPYGRPEDGHPETIQNIFREDLVNFHKKHFGPANMVIVIVGAVSPEEAVELVEGVLGDWENPGVDSPPLPEITLLEKSVRRHIDVPGKVQTNLVMGTIGPKRRSDDYLPASLGNNILGQFGLMGRIGDVVREKEGLAYYASTSLSAWIESGSWEVSAGVNPKNLQRAIDLIISELERFVHEKVSLEEISDSQSNFIGRLPLSMESNLGVASALLRLERFQLGLDYYRQYPRMVREVTPELILEIARRYLDTEKLCTISAGPESE